MNTPKESEMVFVDWYFEENTWGMFTNMLHETRSREFAIPWIDDNTPGWKTS